MTRYRLISSIFLTMLYCFFGLSFSYAQEFELTPQYYNVKSFKLKSGAVIEDLKIEYATLVMLKRIARTVFQRQSENSSDRSK